MKALAKHQFILFSFLLCMMAACSGGGKPRPGMEKIQQFEWLTGSWVQHSEQGIFFETWSQKNDTLYTGTACLISGKDTLFRETMSLLLAGAELYYIPLIGGREDQPAVWFRLVADDNGIFVFENNEHDFPQRIVYTHPTADSLYAFIEGTENGEFRKEEFPMQRMLDK